MDWIPALVKSYRSASVTAIGKMKCFWLFTYPATVLPKNCQNWLRSKQLTTSVFRSMRNSSA